MIRCLCILLCLLCLLCAASPAAPQAPQLATDPEAAKLVTSDIERFWVALEMYPEHGGIPHIVAHELIHYQQLAMRRGGPRTLLAQSILEGSADFVAEMISGKHINPRAHEYGIAHEPQLWREFRAQMHASDYAGWLYGGAPDGRPADLGYFFGYRIAQAYYDRAGDERQAIREILSVTGFERFLEASGYESSW